jgi:SPP1 family predicted phage head-tail adaptor
MAPISTFLNGRAPTQLRGAAFLALSDSAHLVRGTVTDDQGGGATTSWATSGTIPCRIVAITGYEFEAADRLSDRSTHRVTLPADADVNVTDRLAIDGKGNWQVVAVRDLTAEPTHVIEVVSAD